MKRNLLVATAAVVITIAAVVIVVLVSTRGPHGAASPQAAVDAYVSALRDNDSGRLKDLADPDHDPSQEIKNRLTQLGGDSLSSVSTSIGSTESDFTKPVYLTGVLNGQPYTDTLWLYRHGSRWFIALGPHRHPHPKGT